MEKAGVRPTTSKAILRWHVPSGGARMMKGSRTISAKAKCGTGPCQSPQFSLGSVPSESLTVWGTGDNEAGAALPEPGAYGVPHEKVCLMFRGYEWSLHYAV
jgi:hypothetical protein